MVNNNGIPFEVKKPFETVYEIKNETPSFEEFMKGYENDGNLNYDDLNGGGLGEIKGYGPCKKSYCNCSCDKNSCNCEWDVEDWMGESNCERYGFLRTSGKGKIRKGDDGNFKNGVLDADGSFSAAASKSSSEEARFFGLSAGGSASLNKEDGIRLKGKLGIDAYNFKDEDKEIRLGLNVDTGVKFDSDNVEVKFLGLRFSVGDGQVGLSTPIAEAKCAVQ